MGIELDFGSESGGFDPENMDNSPVPGKFHILIHDIDDTDPAAIYVNYEILDGDVADQAGKEGRERLPRVGKNSKTQVHVTRRLVQLATALKITTLEELAAIKKAGKNPTIEFSEGSGRQICVELAKNGDYVNWTFGGIWAVDDDDAKDIPKSEGMLAEAHTTSAGDESLDDVTF